MKRQDFIKIIKLRSFWKIDKRRGNYTLPNGEKLSVYVEKLVDTQLDIDKLGILSSGNICSKSGGNWNDEIKDFDNITLMPDFEKNEIVSFDEHEKRIKRLVNDIIF